MKSFEYDYLLEMPISHTLLSTVRAIGEFRGRQRLYAEQSPEMLDTLRKAAMIQSAESSNRIEGIIVEPRRIEGLVMAKTAPKDRPEQEVAGYRDVLNEIHNRYAAMTLSSRLIRDWHKAMHHYVPDEKGGQWKRKDNAIFQVQPDGRKVIRFRPDWAAADSDAVVPMRL